MNPDSKDVKQYIMYTLQYNCTLNLTTLYFTMATKRLPQCMLSDHPTPHIFSKRKTLVTNDVQGTVSTSSITLHRGSRLTCAQPAKCHGRFYVNRSV